VTIVDQGGLGSFAIIGEARHGDRRRRSGRIEAPTPPAAISFGQLLADVANHELARNRIKQRLRARRDAFEIERHFLTRSGRRAIDARPDAPSFVVDEPYNGRNDRAGDRSEGRSSTDTTAGI
jgi:hypothetical protein